MTPGIFRIVPDHKNLEEQIERQMGCLAGFLQLFDRHQILTGKNLYSTKRLRNFSTAGSSSPSERSEISSMSLVKEGLLFPSSPSPEECPSPENYLRTKPPRNHTLPLPVFEMKDGVKTSWKLRQAPRLSLNSRASVNTKGKPRPREIQTAPVLLSGALSEGSGNMEGQEKQRRSPSVVARLMGLDTLPGTFYGEQPKKSELHRSASGSRVPRDTSQFNFNNSSLMLTDDVFRLRYDCSEPRFRDTKHEAPRQSTKGFFHSQEFFSEPKSAESLYGEMGKSFQISGMKDSAMDLETLKQILEALQLKGLLHSNPPEHREDTRLNITFDTKPRTSYPGQSPIVVMKPASKSPSRLTGQHSTPPPRSISSHCSQVPIDMPQIRAQRDRILQKPSHQSPRSPVPKSRSCSPCGSPVRRRCLNAEGQMTPLSQRHTPTVNSLNTSSKKLHSTPLGSPNKRRPTVDIFVRDNIFLPEGDDKANRTGTVENSSGRRLLERCDKLLHSIAAITSFAEQATPTDRQPSPVSVLDSTFLSDESLAHSQPRRAVNYNEQSTEWDEDHWNLQPLSTAGPISSLDPLLPETTAGITADFVYVADAVRELELNHSVEDAFKAVENRYCSAASSPLHRKLIFDAVTELIDRKRHLLPWDAFYRVTTASSGMSLAQEVWEELHRTQQHAAAEDVMEAIRAVIRKDMAGAVGEQGWGVPAVEISSAVLHIERQVFKDLVADTIKTLAELVGRYRRSAALSRRKLRF